MAKYLVPFPGAAMVVPDGGWEAVGRDAHAGTDEAKAAGVHVFGGGIDEDVPPMLVSAGGTAVRRSCQCAGGESLPAMRRGRPRSGVKRTVAPAGLRSRIPYGAQAKKEAPRASPP